MLHFYIDESGTGLRDKRSPYFVLAAVAIPTRELAQVDEQVNAFKRQLIPFAEPEDFEFKVRELRRGERFFRGIPWQIRAQAILEMSSLMAALPCRVLAVQVHKGHLTDYIEADDQLSLSHALRTLNVRLAKRLNRHFARRGPLLAERYHARRLATPREVRNVLRYILLNSRHHAAQRGQRLARGWPGP